MTAAVLTGTGAAHVTGTGAAHVTQRGDDRIATCVEIGYDNPPSFGIPNGQWVDVTQNVLSASTNRGRSQELQRFESGTLSMRLDNRSGNYSVWGGSGATIGCPIRVRISAEKSDPTGSSPDPAVYDPTDGGFYYAFSGFITDLTYGWSPGGVGGAWCDIQAADAFALLNRASLASQTFPTGGTATGVVNPREVPVRHDEDEVALNYQGAGLLVPAHPGVGILTIVNTGPNAIYIGDISVTIGSGTVVASGGTVLISTPTEALYATADGGVITLITTSVAGTNYVVGDVVTIAGGVSTKATLIVDAVGGGGDVTSYHPLTLGSGYVPAANVATTGGSGGGFTVNIVSTTTLANQSSPADTYWTYDAGVQYGHDRLVQGIDLSGVKGLFPGLHIRYDTAGPDDLGSGSFYVPSAPCVSAGAQNPVTANLLEHLQVIAESAFMDFYAGPDGIVYWRPYSEIRDNAFDGTTVFGDNIPTEIPYQDASPDYSDQNLFNDVTVTLTPDGSLTYGASDATSIGLYGRRVYTPSFDVWPQEIGDTTLVPSASFPVDAFLERYKDPIVHVPSIAVSLRGCTDAQRRRVLTLPIGYRVQVKRRPAGGDNLTAECHFEGISLTWSPGMVEVKAVLNLAPVRAPGAYS